MSESGGEFDEARDIPTLTMKAAACGCELIVADARTLLLDLDDDVSLDAFHKNLDVLRNHAPFTLTINDQWTSKGGNTHIVVGIDRDTPIAERCLLQAILGSDRTREALTMARYRTYGDDIIALFKPIKEDA